MLIFIGSKIPIMIKIYTLSEPETGEVRYIGKTKHELASRLYQHIHEKTKCHRYYWIQKLIKSNKRPVIELVDLVPGNNWQFWERFYISLFKSWGFNLCNNTEGGEGIDGYKHTDETKCKLRAAQLGKKHTKASIKKMKDRTMSEENKNKVKLKLSISIVQLDKNGVFVKEWQSSRQACRELGIRIGSLSSCLNGKTKSCFNCVWVFKKDFDATKNYSLLAENRYRKCIAQYTKNNIFIRNWDSIIEAAISLKINVNNIGSCCKNRRILAGGFRWSYVTNT
jgi:hypothetical protein